MKCYHDLTHVILRSMEDQEKEEKDEENEPEILKSFFVYRPFSYLYAFYDSMYFIEQEKKFRFMSKRDISKCFDSIYTHSIDWAVWGKNRAKPHANNLDTFTAEFDKIMQNMNYKETHGIVIGPEFSRVFAEMILSSVDNEVYSALKKKSKEHGIDYQIFRYVDDYIIFTNSEEDTRLITKVISDELDVYKLYFNEAKSIDNICRPFSTDITNAKSRVRRLIIHTFNDFFFKRTTDKSIQMKTYNGFRPSSFITAYKEILSTCGVSYKNLGSYTVNMLVRILRKEFDIIKDVYKTNNRQKMMLEKQYVNAFEYGIRYIFEVLFFFVHVLNSVSPVVTIVMFADYCLDDRNKLLKDEDRLNIVEDYFFQEITRFLDYSSMKENRDKRAICLYLVALALRLGKDYRIPESMLEKLVDADNFDYFTDISIIRYCTIKTGYDEFCDKLIERAISFVSKECKKTKPKIRCAILSLLILDLLSLSSCTKDKKKEIVKILRDAKILNVPRNESNKEMAERLDFFSNKKMSPFCWENNSLFVELELKRGLFVY